MTRLLTHGGRTPARPFPTPAQLLPAGSAIRCHTLAAAVGNTPVLWIDQPFTTDGRGFWAKLEDRNPGGMKDRPALHMIGCARHRGDLAPGGAVVESTSGTFGLGLALAGLVYGHPVTLVTDPGMERLMHRLLVARGARIDVVTRPDPVGGWQEARCRRVAELLAAHPGSYCPDQYNNPDNVAGYESLAVELLAQLGRVDVLVCSVGTGGHSAGVSRTLRQFCYKPAIVAGCALRTGGLRTGDRGSWRDDWRTVVANRPFVLFSVAMVGSYVLAFQIYLALPLETRRLAGDGATGTAAVTALFVVSGFVALAGQVSITAWCKRRWPPGRCLAVGLTILATAFVPPLAASQLATDPATSSSPTAAALRSLPLLVSAALLALGTVIVFPFEMDTITVLGRGQLPATHYGLYNTICGVGILTGNLATGTALDTARDAGLAALPWLALSMVGFACAAAIRALDRSARLGPAPPVPVLQAR